MATDWEERSDVEYDVKHMSHPRRLAQEQLVSAADGTSMVGVKQAMGASPNSRANGRSSCSNELRTVKKGIDP